MCGKKFLVTAVLGMALSLLPYSCYASQVISSDDAVLYMTQVEYERLVNNLEELNRLNITSDNKLTASKMELQRANEKLLILQKELNELNRHCQMLKLQTIEQEKLLAIANDSLEKYAKEESKARQKIKRQRNTAYAALGVLAIAYIRK